MQKIIFKIVKLYKNNYVDYEESEFLNRFSKFDFDRNYSTIQQFNIIQLLQDFRKNAAYTCINDTA